jgi:tetratricopeptide (TPR) repeat protein
MSFPIRAGRALLPVLVVLLGAATASARSHHKKAKAPAAQPAGPADAAPDAEKTPPNGSKDGAPDGAPGGVKDGAPDGAKDSAKDGARDAPPAPEPAPADGSPVLAPSPATAAAADAGATAAPQPSGAAVAGDDAPSPAETYIERGRTYFKDKRFAEAAEMLQKAYALEPKPMLLFNMAQAYRRAGRVRDAYPLYQRFLSADPHTTLKAETEGYIAELSVVLAEEDRAEKERSRPLYKKGWFWGVVAASAAVVIGTSLGVGLGLGLRDNRQMVNLNFP